MKERHSVCVCVCVCVCATCTCPESERGDWSPVLCETHQRLIHSDVVNDDASGCRANTDYVHRGALESLSYFKCTVRNETCSC